MSDDKVDPSKKDPQISIADDLTKTKKGDGELSEEELKNVSGGNIGSQSKGAGAGKVTFDPF
jgi:bacteriocin-like protein